MRRRRRRRRHWLRFPLLRPPAAQGTVVRCGFRGGVWGLGRRRPELTDSEWTHSCGRVRPPRPRESWLGVGSRLVSSSSKLQYPPPSLHAFATLTRFTILYFFQ